MYNSRDIPSFCPQNIPPVYLYFNSFQGLCKQKSRTARKPLTKDLQQFCLHDFYITSDTICPVLLPDISLTTLYGLPGGIQPKGPALWAKPFSQFPVIIYENTVLYQPFCLLQDRCSLKLSLVFLPRFTAALIRRFPRCPFSQTNCSP